MKNPNKTRKQRRRHNLPQTCAPLRDNIWGRGQEKVQLQNKQTRLKRVIAAKLCQIIEPTDQAMRHCIFNMIDSHILLYYPETSINEDNVRETAEQIAQELIEKIQSEDIAVNGIRQRMNQRIFDAETCITRSDEVNITASVQALEVVWALDNIELTLKAAKKILSITKDPELRTRCFTILRIVIFTTENQEEKEETFLFLWENKKEISRLSENSHLIAHIPSIMRHTLESAPDLNSLGGAIKLVASQMGMINLDPEEELDLREQKLADQKITADEKFLCQKRVFCIKELLDQPIEPQERIRILASLIGDLLEADNVISALRGIKNAYTEIGDQENVEKISKLIKEAQRLKEELNRAKPPSS